MNDIRDMKKKYFCSICDTYHKPKYRGKPNQTFINHQEYAIEVSQSYIYNKTLIKSFNSYDINKHKKSIGSSKQ